MRITVTFYGVLKATTGMKTQTLDLPGGISTVGELAAHLVERYPAIEPHLAAVAYVVGDEIVEPEWPLKDGDEVGLLPPVSGG